MSQQKPIKNTPSRRDLKARPSTTVSTAGREAFIDPFSDATLTSYLANVRDWHGYIRFLGLPHLRDNPDVMIDKLYVEPLLAETYVSPDTPPENWPKAETVLQTLAEHSRLVLLGDPGSGKSALVNWLAWQFSQPATNEWAIRFGRLIPVPMVLRELEISKGTTWEGLVQAFLNHDMARPLNGYMLQELLERGQLLIMLDGLDEIGDSAVRESLRLATFAGMGRYPLCRWLMTSRIVGYETVRFHRLFPKRTEDSVRTFTSGRAADWLAIARAQIRIQGGFSDALNAVARAVGDVDVAELRYVLPFNDDQSARFARNWFTQREAARETAERQALNLIEALHQDPATTRLARVPNLLTMMALIHRVRARLPHGRALLYNEITQAYLQSIDEHRGLLKEEYPYAQKRRWLARVGFEMQRRRSAMNDSERESSRDILVSEKAVINWIASAMQESDGRLNDQTAAAFVDWIGRRSGLLLPRGPGQFAFMHLSFQEYFAACFLVERVMSPSYNRRSRTALGPGCDDLREYAREPLWRETLVFLFELLADHPEWPQILAEDLFGEKFSDLNQEFEKSYPAAVLLARLAIDPHSGLSGELRIKAISACWHAEMATQPELAFENEIARLLFAAEPDLLPIVWNTLTSAARARKVTWLNLDGCLGIDSLSCLSGLTLEGLTLSGTSLSDLNGVQKLRSLTYLSIDGTKVTDLTPLGSNSNLGALSVSDTAISDLSPLAKLGKLRELVLYFTGRTDMIDLSALKALTSLSISATKKMDLGFVTKMSALTNLCVFNTSVIDLMPLIGINKLKSLDLIHTTVPDFSPLSHLRSLESLGLTGINILDLAPLQALKRLKRLNLNGTRVTDLSPIAQLESLRQLSLNATNVSDLSPLHHLPRLETITALETNISDAQIEALRKALPKIQIAR